MITDNARLIAATRPIPNGFTSDISITGDDRYLFATYPGVGGVYAWDVEEMIATLDNPNSYQLDHRRRGTGSPLFNEFTQRTATTEDLSSVPIDDINPDITIAADLQLTKDDFRFNGFEFVNDVEFGVPEESTRAPLTIGANPWSIATASHRDWLELLPVEDDEPLTANLNGDDDNSSTGDILTDLTPTLEWKFDEGFEDVERVDLFVTVFHQG